MSSNDGGLLIALLFVGFIIGCFVGSSLGDSAYEHKIHELCVKIVPAGPTFEVDKALRECETVKK